MKKLAIFVDVQNIYYTTKQAFKNQLNYRALWNLASSRGELINAYAYAIESHDIKQRSFQQTLRNIGFNLKLKPYIQRADGSAKADWDVGIALDVFEIAASVDEIILVSGDGDFDILLTRVIERFNINCTVISVKQLTASSLIRSATTYIEINQPLLMK